MNETNTILLDAVLSAFAEVQMSLGRLIQLLRSERGPLWVQSGDRELSHDKESVIQVIAQLEYEDQQEGRETIVRPGLVGVTAATLNEVKTLNRAKDAFKSHVLEFKRIAKLSSKIQFHHYVNHLVDESPALLRHAMCLEGFSRLHLKQCYRHIPVLEAQPHKVSWTWTHTRSIQKISLQEAEARLLKMPMDAGISQQLQKLKLLSPAEHLAVVQELSPHCCANIVLNAAKTQRKMLKSPIPIFYLIEDTNLTPIVVPPTTHRAKDLGRQERSDIKIEKESYLPAIRAHRYLAFISI